MSCIPHRTPAWRVLILDGDVAALSRSKNVILGMGRFEVVAAVRTGREALDLLGRVPCDLLLVDIELDEHRRGSAAALGTRAPDGD